jgi:hypothetical protein
MRLTVSDREDRNHLSGAYIRVAHARIVEFVPLAESAHRNNAQLLVK